MKTVAKKLTLNKNIVSELNKNEMGESKVEHGIY